jgi:hypothetical protein
MITYSIKPPEITTQFSADLLLTLLQRIERRVEKIKILAAKKLKENHVGRRRQFVILLMKFNEEYERKKIEEADYKAENKKKIEERPSLSNVGSTCTFKRLRFQERSDECSML